jgi:hypothetical protein
MTRKLSGLWSALMANRASLASLAVVGTLACTLAVGCGSSHTGGPPPDAGTEGGPDATTVTACTTPTFSTAAGAVAAGTTVTITAAGLPAGGFIYYTTDATIPTHASTAIASPGTVTVNATETIYAIAYAPGATGCGDSMVAMATYTVEIEAGPTACGAPTFNPPAGAITIGSTVAIVPPAGFPAGFPAGNAQIFYTVDGTIPTHASPAYSGPIQVNGPEAIHAIAYNPGVCTDSTVALANYTVMLPDGGTAPPAFNPPSTTQNNDFLVSLTDTPGATICFSFGAGSTPTCTITANAATCTGTSQTYNAGAGLAAAGSVTINGGVTSAAGVVTVNALACEPGGAMSTVVSQVYTLQAAAPTMQGPVPSLTLPYVQGGYNPMLSSATAGATLRYTTDGTTSTCATGTLAGAGTNPASAGVVTTNSSFNAVACKTGYAPSTPAGFAYGIVLPTPAFVDNHIQTQAEATGTYDAAPTIAFLPGVATNTPTGLFYCSTVDSSTPTCGTTTSTCTGTAVVGATRAITATGTVLKAVACSTSYNASVPFSATYTLMLDPPALDSPTGPGCTETNSTGTLCAGPLANPPTVAVTQVSAPPGGLTTDIEETIGPLPPSALGVQPPYQFVCAQNNGTPSCASSTGCSAGAMLITGGANFQTPLTVALGVPINAGDNWSLIGCPGSTSPGFLPSAVTTIQVAVPGAAPSPAVAAGTGGGTYTSPVTPTFTSTKAENVCYGIYSATGTAPTAAITCNTTTGACGAGTGYASTGSLAYTLPAGPSTVTSITVSPGGTGYTSAPTVIVAPPPAGTGNLQAQYTAKITSSLGIALATGGSGCSASAATNPAAIVITDTSGGTGAAVTATVGPLNTVTALNVTNPGAGYSTTSTITVNFAAVCTGTQPTVTLSLFNGVVSNPLTLVNAGSGYTSVPAVTFTGGGGTGATATAVLTPVLPQVALPAPLQINGTNVDVLGCIAGSPASPLTTYKYAFAEAPPTVVDTTATPNAPIATGNTLTLGDTLTLSTTSAFTSAPPYICYTTDGTVPNPACITGATTTTCKSTAAAVTIATSPTTFTNGNTLQAITCNQASQTDQTNSAAYTAALNPILAIPVATKPGGIYYNLLNPTLATSSATPICYTTAPGGTPSCNATGCTNGTTPYAGAITLTTTGTTIKAITCAATYTSQISSDTYTFNVSPIILSNGPVLPLSHANIPPNCPATIDVGLDCSEGHTGGGPGCTSSTFAAGGATAGATICYTVDGSPVTSCPTAAGTAKCMTAGDIPIAAQSAPFKINALACATNFGNSSTGATPLAVTVTPYSAAVAFTGVPATDFVPATNNDQFGDTGAGGGFGYFSTNGTTLYVGMDTIAPLASTYVTIYIGNGGTGATGTTTATGMVALPAAAGFQYALQIPTVPGNTGTLYNWTAGGWAAGAAQAVTVNTGMTTEEIAIPLTSLPQLETPSTITVMGSEVTGALTVGVATAFTFPVKAASANYAEWIAYPTGSCLYPTQAITP